MTTTATKKKTRTEWASIPCPKCGETIHRVNAKAVISLEYAGVKHECGFFGVLRWQNPLLVGCKGETIYRQAQ